MLLALVDANYCFTYVNFGCQSRISDGGVFRNSALSKSLENNPLHFPDNKPLIGRTESIAYTVITDDAFPLTTRFNKII